MSGPSGKAPAPKVDIGAFAFSTVQPGSTKTPLSNNDTKTKTTRRPRNGLKLVTLLLPECYHKCNLSFDYSPSFNPRRVLTHPAEGVSNSNFDNCNSDYIIYVNDIIGSTPNHRYQVLDLLGQGTFGQVVKCRNCDTDEITALKILKNKPAYLNQGLVEIRILELLNQHYDSENKHHIARLVDYFIFRRHLCLVFELLSVNLYELIKQNHFRGLSTNLIRVFMIQLLDALMVLSQANIIHCDMKPENVLLQMLNSPSIKLIDFGSACFESQTVYSYIQSRHYRSPEVLIGTKYTAGIDMWSLGCIAAELFLGLPLFPGTSEYNQLARIIEMQGYPPDYMLDGGKQTSKFFDHFPEAPAGSPRYLLKSEKAYAEESGINIPPAKRYFNYIKLDDLIQNYSFKKNASASEVEKEHQNRAMFCDFVSGLVKIDPKERWTPLQAKEHPFITGEPFTKPFVPNPALRKPPPIKSIPRLPLNPASPFHPMSAPAAAANAFPPPAHTVGSTNAKKNMYKPGPDYVASPESYSPRGYFTHMMQQQGSNISLGASPSISHFGPPSPYSSYPYHLHGPPMSIPASPSFSAWPEAGGPYPPNYTHPHQQSAPNNNSNRRARSKSDSKDLPHMIPPHEYRKRGDPPSVASTPVVRGPVIGESPATSHFMFPGSLTSPRGERGSASTTPSTPSSMGRGRHPEQQQQQHPSQNWTPNRIRSRSFGNDNLHPPQPQFDRQQPHSPRRPQQNQATHSPEQYSRSPSDDDPSNWDPNYSDEQLLFGYEPPNTTSTTINATPPKRHSPHQQAQQHHHQQQQQQQQYYQQQQMQQHQFSNWGQPQPPSSLDEANALYGNFSNLYIDASSRRGPPASTATPTTTSNNNNNNSGSHSNPGTSIPSNANMTVGSASVASSWAQNSWTMPTIQPDSYGSSYDQRGDSSALLGFSPYIDANRAAHEGHYSSPPTSSTSSSFASYMQQQHSAKYGRSPPKQQASHKNSHRSNNNSNTNRHPQNSPPTKSTPIHHQQQHHHSHHHNKQPQQQQPHYSHQALRTPPRPPNVIFSSPATPQQQTATPVLPTAQAIFGSHVTPSTSHLSPFIDRSSSIPKSPDASSTHDERTTTQDVFTHLFVADIDENEERNDPSPHHHRQPFGTTTNTT